MDYFQLGGENHNNFKCQSFIFSLTLKLLSCIENINLSILLFGSFVILWLGMFHE